MKAAIALPLLLAILTGAPFVGLAMVRRRWISARRTAETLARIAPALLEQDEFFVLLDLAGPDSHFLERHGPMLRTCEVLDRAQTGTLEFSGLAGRPVASSRWLRHSDLLAAILSAEVHWESGKRPEGGRFVFEFDRDIGEGYLKGGGALVRTRVAVVVIRGGQTVTAYPSLAALAPVARQAEAPAVGTH